MNIRMIRILIRMPPGNREDDQIMDDDNIQNDQYLDCMPPIRARDHYECDDLYHYIHHGEF